MDTDQPVFHFNWLKNLDEEDLHGLQEDDFIKEKRPSSLSPFEKKATSFVGKKLVVTNIGNRKRLRKHRFTYAAILQLLRTQLLTSIF